MKTPNSASLSTRIGIRREDINKWERRAPLIPSHVRELVQTHGLDIRIQPSAIRVFPDADYALVGARVQENICPCPVIFAIKEIPLESVEKDKVYVFFSHTAKGQPRNMPMLKRMMELGCSIIDYEKMVDEKGRRILFFGGFAGQAGMIDTLWALGKRLEIEGIETPFLRLSQTVRYKTLVEAKEEVVEVGRRILDEGLHPRLNPLVCGFLGYGHVSQGAQEIFDLLPFEEIGPRELPALFRKGQPKARGLYKVVFKEDDMVRTVSPASMFGLQDYYDNPSKYVPVVEDFIPYMTVLINAIYWTPKFPKFVTKSFLKKLYHAKKAPRLKVIGDISCDIDGSIECTLQATDSENPVYVYDVDAGAAVNGFRGKGPAVMAVYNLPAELPLESSIYFSSRLKEIVPAIATANFRDDFDRCKLPAEVKKAVILFRGKLTPDYQFLSEFTS